LEKFDESGYTDYVPSLPGCLSEGDTKEGLHIQKKAESYYLKEPLCIEE